MVFYKYGDLGQSYGQPVQTSFANLRSGIINTQELIMQGAASVLRSANYNETTGVGWRIRGDGSATFYGLLSVGGDIESADWDGTSPADLSAGEDAGATTGFYLDSSAGAAQFMTIYAVGGELTSLSVVGDLDLQGSGAFRTDSSGTRVEMTNTADAKIDFYSGDGDEENNAYVGTSFGPVLDVSGPTETGIAAGFLSLFGNGGNTLYAYNDILLWADNGEVIIDGNTVPETDGGFSLGSTTKAWGNVYLDNWAYFNKSNTAFVGHDGSNMFVRNGDTGHLYLEAYTAAKDVIIRAKDSGGTIRNRIVVDGNDDLEFYWHNGTALFFMDESAAYTPSIQPHGEDIHRLEFNWQGSSTWKWRFMINNSAMLSMIPAGFYAPQVYTQTTGSAANVNVATAGFLRRVSSTEEWKRGIEDWHNDDGYSVLDFVPVTYHPMDSEAGKWTVQEERILGLSYEQALRVFPLAAMENDKSLDWNAINTGLLYEVKALRDRIAALEARL